MQPEQLLPLIGFIIAMVATPGPNNLMLMAAGANFGFRRSLPHLLGISVGCQILLLAIALGLGKLFETYPQVVTVLRAAGSLFLLYMAWQLLRPAAGLGQSGAAVAKEVRPLTFWQAALFQWINPKAWMMTITAVATFANPAQFVVSTLIIGMLFLVLGFPLISAWNVGGAALKHWLQQGRRLVRFNRVMAVLLVGSLYPLLT
ncbi:MAG: LysE family translocator [Pseudomonadota bacterium]